MTRACAYSITTWCDGRWVANSPTAGPMYGSRRPSTCCDRHCRRGHLQNLEVSRWPSSSLVTSTQGFRQPASAVVASLRLSTLRWPPPCSRRSRPTTTTRQRAFMCRLIHRPCRLRRRGR